MSVFDAQISRLDGAPGLLDGVKGRAALFVNVASRCGLTPQYRGWRSSTSGYARAGLQRPRLPLQPVHGAGAGLAEEIAEFCSATYGVTFPLTGEDRGERRRPAPALRASSAPCPTTEGHTGDIRWNFEKFLIGPDGDGRGPLPPQHHA